MENKPTTFDDIIQRAETIDQPTGLDVAIEESEKEKIWKAKRVLRVTASKLDNYAKSGKKKGEVFGEMAKGVLMQVKGQRRTGQSFDKDLDLFNFRWGKENEPKAFNKLKAKYPKIISGTNENEIIFRTMGDIFGDSPDLEGLVKFPMFDEEIECTGEIKCPVDRSKIEAQREQIQFFTTAENGKRSYHEYFWQMIGHLIGNLKAKVCIYVVYDAYEDEIYEHLLFRHEVNNEIEFMNERLDFGETILEKCEKDNWSNKSILNINELWVEFQEKSI